MVFLTSTSSPRTYSLQRSLPSCKTACAASGCLIHRDGLDLVKLRPECNCIHLEYLSHPLQRPILEGNVVRFVSFHTTLLDNIKNPERCQNIMLWELSFQRVGGENEKCLALFSAGQQKLRTDPATTPDRLSLLTYLNPTRKNMFLNFKAHARLTDAEPSFMTCSQQT